MQAAQHAWERYAGEIEAVRFLMAVDAATKTAIAHHDEMHAEGYCCCGCSSAVVGVVAVQAEED